MDDKLNLSHLRCGITRHTRHHKLCTKKCRKRQIVVQYMYFFMHSITKVSAKSVQKYRMSYDTSVVHDRFYSQVLFSQQNILFLGPDVNS